jgi:hypothetical protein
MERMFLDAEWTMERMSSGRCLTWEGEVIQLEISGCSDPQCCTQMGIAVVSKKTADTLRQRFPRLLDSEIFEKLFD